MASRETTTTAEPAPQTAAKATRNIALAIDALIVLLALFVGLCTFVYLVARFAQPRLDGDIQLAGLHTPVGITRDERGIPHIRAGDAHDLFMAQGYAMAQDRLWQMDVMRRLGEGRLSEIFGTRGVEYDTQTRRLGLNRVAEAEARTLPADERESLEAFALGVNQFIVARGSHRQLEFRLLRYRPQLWTVADTLAVGAQMYRELTMSYHDELMREEFLARAGTAADALFPFETALDIVPGAGQPFRTVNAALTPILETPAHTARQTAFEVIRNDIPAPASLGASNNWAISGVRSETGKPILANDPHLRWQIPGIWWAVDLSDPHAHVAGVALVGAPGVIIGHNDRIAWGVTNVGADVQDLYREKLRGNREVLTPDGWQPLQVISERIKVRGRPDTVVDVSVTRHGPIVAEDRGGPLALHWSLYDPGSLRFLATFTALARARNWADFKQALANFPGPAQNFVYADVDGHIGYYCAARIPIRASGDGTVPVPGDTDEFRWTGWIPFAELPHAYEPVLGVLATANGRISPDHYPFLITKHWDAPYRTRRIYGLLNPRARWAPGDMSPIQTDVTSELDRLFAAALVAAAGRQHAANSNVEPLVDRAVATLRDFDGRMDRSSIAPTIESQAREEFLERVLAARFGKQLATGYHWSEAPVFVQQLVQQRPDQWLPPDYKKRGWDGLLVDSLASILTENSFSPRVSHWGRHEDLFVPHPVFTHVPLLRAFTDLGPVELSGSGLTVKQTTPSLGPSMRMVADLANWDNSTLTLFAGESGLPFSGHYRDEFPAYLRGQALPLWFSDAAVHAHQSHHLTLRPAPQQVTQ